MEISFPELQVLESHHVSFRVLYHIEVLQSKVSVKRPPSNLGWTLTEIRSNFPFLSGSLQDPLL
jgi:hypothetical protein